MSDKHINISFTSGTVIKTMGDEVMATFTSADDALNAAAQMQRLEHLYSNR